MTRHQFRRGFTVLMLAVAIISIFVSWFPAVGICVAALVLAWDYVRRVS